MEVYDAFGVDDVLSLDEEDYSMRMGPSDDSPWSAVIIMPIVRLRRLPPG
jgi:hypothetical protein